MINFVVIVGLGLLLGMRHATDPDHVIAVTTIVSRERNVKRAGLIGIAWGAGHTLTILAVGSAMILFRIVLPPRVGLGMEFAVAVMLVLLGIRNMGALFGQSSIAVASGTHAHHHDGEHVHTHEDTPVRVADRWFGRSGAYQLVRPLVIGVVHGLAGSAAIALLVLSTIQSVRWALVYLLVFGLGTILGMMLITTILASAFHLGQKRFAPAGRHFGLITGVISVALGLFIAYQITFVHGLFGPHVRWIPR